MPVIYINNDDIRLNSSSSDKVVVTGNLGIGTTAPGAKLTIGPSFATTNGFTIDTSDSSHSQIIARKTSSKTAFGVLAWDTSVFLSAGIYYEGGAWVQGNHNGTNQLFTFSPGSGVRWYASNNGSGSWNVSSDVQLWDDAAIWTSLVRSTRAGNSYFTGGNVGIGTTNPTQKLQVDGSIALNVVTDGTSRYYTYPDANHSWYYDDNIVGSSADVMTYYENFLVRHQDTTNVFLINGSGNVGIGTTSPTQILSISRVSTDNYIKVEAGGQAANYSGLMLTEYGINWGWALRHNAATDLLHISYQDNTPTFSDSVTFNRNGNVGIGTTSPTNKLTIQSNSTQLRLETASDPSGYHSFIESNYNAANPLNIYSSAAASYAMGTISLGGISGVNTYLNSYYGIIFGTSTSSITAGTVRMMITNDGNVGIGATSPSYKLQVQADGAGLYVSAASVSPFTQDIAVFRYGGNGNAVKIENQGGKAAIQARLDNGTAMDLSLNASGGNVGIGTSSPASSLHVAGGNIMISNTVAAGAPVGALVFKQTNSTGFDVAQIQTIAGATVVEGILTMSTKDSGGTMVERMRITSAGNVGIGTTAPGFKLDTRISRASGNFLSDGLVYAIGIQNTDTTAGNATAMAFGHGGYEYTNFIASVRTSIGANPTGDLAFGGRPSDNANFVERLRITSAGNVGIGTTSPSAKLDVSVSSGAAWMNLINESESAFRLTTYNNGTGSGTSAYAFKHGLYYNATENASVTFYRGGSSTGGFLTFTTNDGTERMRIDASGNVSIGTTSAAAKLHVDGAIRTSFLTSGNAFLEIYSGSVAGYIEQKNDNPLITIVNGSERMRITSAGNVGIGTTSPGFRLDVAGAVSDWAARFYSNASASAYFANGGGYGGYIDAGSNASSSTYLLQLISNGSSRVYVRGDGNVGIGTTSPTNKLHVNGGSIFNQDGFLYMSNQFPIVWGSSASIEGDSSNNTISVRANGSIRIQVVSSGFVGIGTTAPQQLLHVLGATDGYMMVQGANDAGNAGIYFKKEDTTGTMDRTKGLILFHTNVGSGFGRGHLGFCLNSADSNTVVSISDEKFRMVDNGDFLADGDVVAYSTTISDERYKTNITPIDSALDKVNQMRGVSFDWTAVRSGREFGVIAQEIEKIAPEVVSSKELLNGETMKTVSYTSLVPFLIESIKELTARVEELEQKLKQ